MKEKADQDCLVTNKKFNCKKFLYKSTICIHGGCLVMHFHHVFLLLEYYFHFYMYIRILLKSAQGLRVIKVLQVDSINFLSVLKIRNMSATHYYKLEVDF